MLVATVVATVVTTVVTTVATTVVKMAIRSGRYGGHHNGHHAGRMGISWAKPGPMPCIRLDSQVRESNPIKNAHQRHKCGYTGYSLEILKTGL